MRNYADVISRAESIANDYPMKKETCISLALNSWAKENKATTLSGILGFISFGASPGVFGYFFKGDNFNGMIFLLMMIAFGIGSYLANLKSKYHSLENSYYLNLLYYQHLVSKGE